MIRYHPFRHLGLKVLAIALATLLWLTVAGEHVVERSLRVPLEFRNIPAELEIVGDPPAGVDVRVRGSSAVLSRVEPGEIVAVLDLSAARAGSRLFNLRSDEVRAPFGIEISQVVPPTLSLELARSAHRVVPVVPAVQGDPAPGFVVGRVTSEPATVEIIGPDTRVQQLAEATTEPVNVGGARTRVRDVVTIGVADSAVRLAVPQNATVLVDVWPAPVERDVDGVDVQWRNLPGGLKAVGTPAVVQVAIRGSRGVVAAARPQAIAAFVDLAGLKPGRYNLRVQADPGDGYAVSRITPATVAVVIRKGS